MLWAVSAIAITIAFCVFDKNNYLTLFASLIGVTALIFCSKGNPFGQLLVIIFSLFYGIISFTFSYYGEILTYLCMTMPMAVFALISWKRNPYSKEKVEVRVNHLSRKEWFCMWILVPFVTLGFYFILDYFSTANIIPSTISVTTSFIAVFIAFFVNDILYKMLITQFGITIVMILFFIIERFFLSKTDSFRLSVSFVT